MSHRFAAILVAFLALPSLAQTTEAVHRDDFQSYGTQKNPPGWVDTAIGSSKPEASGLYKTWPDPTQGNKGANVVFGSKSASGKPEGSNPRIGHFSTLTTKTFSGTGRFEYRGRFIRTSTDSRIGLTFFSSYPEKDSYYLVGLWTQPSTGKLTMQLHTFGGGAPSGTLDSSFTPEIAKWYSFLIQADDSNGKTTIRAKFWLDTNPEPAAFSINAVDASAGRLKSGRIGIWAAVKGENYVDDLFAKSPVDHTAPVITFLENGAPLIDGTRFNRPAVPEIVVTDDLTPPAQINVTAQLDGATYVSKTPVTGQGNHTLTVHAVDSVGNAADATVKFYVDTIPPKVTVVSPKADSMSATDVTIALQVVDDSLPYTVSATLDGASYDVTRPVTTEGRHVLAMRVTDAVGLFTDVPPITFYVDKSNPTYVLKEGNNPFPSDGFVFDRDITINVDPQDLTPTTVTLTLDGGPYTEGALVTSEGSHTITGTVSDAVGHVVTITPRRFIIDKTAPVVTLSESGAAIKTYYDRAVTPAIQVTDVSDYTVSATLNGATFTFGQALTEEKKYTLAGTVKDSANHTTPFGPVEFYIDKTAPQVTLKANGASFPASGTVFDADVVAGVDISDLTPVNTSIVLDGQSVTLPVTVSSEQTHKLSAVVTDALNHTTTVSVEFVIDKTPPSVSVEESGAPLADGRYFNRTVIPDIVVTDSTQTTTDATLDGQTFTTKTPVTSESPRPHVLQGKVTDAANHVVPFGPITFFIDTTAPTGVFMEGNAAFPAGKSVNRDVTARVAIDDHSPTEVTILLDGQPYTENAPITSEQSHTLTATLLDKAGNPGTVPSVTFRIDRHPPVVRLLADGVDFPHDFPFSKDFVADVRVVDASGYTVTGTLDGQPINFPFTITQEGEHTISASATDEAGLTGTAGPITFVLDKTPRAVVVKLNGEDAKPNAIFGVDVAATLQVSAGTTGHTEQITLDGNPYTGGTLITAEGPHTIAGTVTSGSGLVSQIPVTKFTIDKTKPEVTLKNRDEEFPPGGFYFNADVVPVVQCTDRWTNCTPKLVLNGNVVENNEPITEEREHTLVVSAEDEAHNVTTLDPVTFTIDKTPPAITIGDPADNKILTRPETVITGATDDAITVNVAAGFSPPVAATVDLTAKTYTSPVLPLLEGENIITVVGIDRAGNPGTRIIRLFVDTRNPDLTVIKPSGDSCITDADLQILGKVNDANIDAVSVTVGTNTIANALDATKQSFSATFPSIAEGRHTIVIEARDTQGHRTRATLQVFVDRGAPVISVLESGQPFTAKVVNHPVALTIRAADLDSNVQLTVTHGTAPYVSGTLISEEGAHHLDVRALDCAGHQNVLPIDFVIDTQAPVITSTVPANGATIGAIPQNVTGTVAGEAVRIEVEGTSVFAVPTPSGDFTLTGLTFKEGPNELVLRAVDAAGNASRYTYRFSVRTQAPRVEILESGAPLENGLVFNRPVTPVVTSDDPNATITALLNTATYDGKPVTGDGSYTIEGRATDSLNHTGTATRTFTIDTTPPVVHITSPAAGDVNTPAVTVSGTAGDAVSVTVNGVVAQLAAGNFVANNVPLDFAENILIAAGTDAAGNVGRDRILLNYVGSGPGIIITAPADGTLTNRPRIDVIGRVLSPTADNTVTVGSAKVTLDATGAFRLNGYQLVPDDNTITVTATGLTAQTATASVHVVADFTPPALSVLAFGEPLADNKQFPAAVTLALRATDNRAVAAAELSVDGNAQATLPVEIAGQGGHVLTAIARDTAGNETRVDRTFFIGANSGSTGGCRIDSTDPLDGAVIAASSVKIAGRAPGAATVTVAGVNADVADNTFAATIDLPVEGENSIAIQCADATGLTGTRTIKLTRVTGNPSIDITTPTEGFVTADTKITVTGTVGPDVDTADVNGVPATIAGSGASRTFSAANVPLSAGINTLVAHARNKANRTAADSVRVRSIQSPPDISITSPLGDYQTGDTKMVLSGTWAHLDPATLAVSGHSGVAPAVQYVRVSDTNGSWVIRDLLLALGPQTLTVTGRNVLGVTTSATTTVNVVVGAPSITITNPADNSYLPGDQPIAVSGTFTSANGARIDINGTAATIDGSAYNGSAAFSTAGDVTPIVARLTDANENGAYASVRVNRLTAPFTVREAFPAPNAVEVDPGVVILVSFSAPLDLSTVSGNITLTPAGGASVTGQLFVEENILTFAPTALLQSGTAYTLAITTGVKNAAGMPLAQPFTSSFTTALTAPAVPPVLDPITGVDCVAPLVITGTTSPNARLRIEAGPIVMNASAGADGKFSFTYPFNGQSGYQVVRVRVAGPDGSLSPAAEASFRFDCAAPQVVTAVYDRNINKLTITFSKPVKASTLSVGTGGTILLTTLDNNVSGGTAAVSGNNVLVDPADDLRAKTFTLNVSDEITDLGGNKLAAPYAQTFSIGEDVPTPGDGSGFISGEVYDATTGRPLAGAGVTVIVPVTAFSRSLQPLSASISNVSMNATTEARGRYTIPLPEGAHTIQVSAAGYTTVWRQIVVPAGAGVVPIDIRLTRIGETKTSDGVAAISLTSGGDNVITKRVDVAIPGGSVPNGAKVSLTAVGAQSLSGLLPLGWSPLASAELAVNDADGVSLRQTLGANAQISFTLPTSDITAANQVLSLVRYDEDRDEWRVIMPLLSAGSDGKWSASLPSSGAYAVVYPDKAAGLAHPPAATGGATLQPAAGTCAASGHCELAKKSFDAEPKTILPSGRTVATLEVISGGATQFPSGTAVQAYVNEELRLPGGATIVDPPFATDVLLYRNLAGDTGIGQFHLAPSAQATKVIISDGVDHIQILQYPGRLDRGTLVGAEGGRVPGDDLVSVEIPSSATTVELHASASSLSSADLASYGTIAGFRVVGGFSLSLTRAITPNPQDIDGDGVTDAIPPVELSRPARATFAVDTTKLPNASAQVILAEVVDDPVWGRTIRLADPLTAIDTPQAGVNAVRYTTRTIDPSQLPVDGVVREGRYLVLAAELPLAWATGAVRLGAGGPYLSEARLSSFSQPPGAALGVTDVTRTTGVFAIPVPASPVAGFVLVPNHKLTGEGAAINSSSAPAADTTVKLGDVVLVPQSPQLVSTSPANGAVINVSNPVILSMTFSIPIDGETAKSSIAVTNTATNESLRGTINTAGATVTFNPTQPLVAGAQYRVTIHTTLRGLNGSPLGSTATFGFSTAKDVPNERIEPALVHITIPVNGVSRIYGEKDALPAGWRVLPVRQGVDFITRYQTDVKSDRSFDMNVGDGPDESDRVSIDDVIDLRVLNPAGNVAAIIRLTPFITADGKGFIAPVGVTSTFKSAENITVTVPAGAFATPTLINVAFAADNTAFNAVPNVASEVNLYRSINLNFDGVSQKRIEVSFPLGSLDPNREYLLGWLGQSVWGPRIAIADNLRVDGTSLTSAYPPQGQSVISTKSGGLKPADAGLTYMSIKSCLVGVTRQGTYALMDWTMPIGSLGWSLISGIASQVEVMNSLFHSIYMPDFAFSSRDNCAAMPIIKGQPFTLTGVDPTSGMVQFETAYDPIPITDPAVVSIPSPDPDRRGPYPVFGAPWRIETVDMTGEKYNGRGYVLELDDPDDPKKIFVKSPSTPIEASEKLAHHAKIRIYNITRALFSSESEVGADGTFAQLYVDGKRGDQIAVYISTADITADTPMQVVFSEPIFVGTIPAGASEDQKKKIINEHLQTVLKLEIIVDENADGVYDDTPRDITKQALFTVDSQNRRVWATLPGPLTRGAIYRLTVKKELTDPATPPRALGVVIDPITSLPLGNAPKDLPLEFRVRTNPTDVLTQFKLQAIPAFSSAALRDLTRSGNLAFVSALDAGLLVYDLSDPDALKPDPATGNQPEPYSLVPALWTDAAGNHLPGANGFEQHWAVTADQHGRVFGAGLTSTFGVLRTYKVEDFVKAHEDGGQCAQWSNPPISGSVIPENANCKFYGASIVGWRPGWASTLPLSTNMVLTDYPEAYPRKIQVATQDETKSYAKLADLEAAPPADEIEVEGKTELGSTGSGNFRFNLKVGVVKPSSAMTDEEKNDYLIERVTVQNRDLDLSWSVDRIHGEQATIEKVIARKTDRLVVTRNKRTYAFVTLVGYGVAVYDMRAIESNDLGLRCGDGAFKAAHGDLCENLAGKRPRILEKILHTKGNQSSACPASPPFTVAPDGIPNLEFSAETVGLVPGRKNPATGDTDYDQLRVFGLDARRGVLDLTYALPTDGTQPVAKCVTRTATGLLLKDHPRLAGTDTSKGPFRFNAQALYHWELTAAQNVNGARGSVPGTEVKRDYLLVAAGTYGLLVVEVGGTQPPLGPAYTALEKEHLADQIWFAAGVYAVRVIPKTNTAVVLDGKGHVLLVDLTNIDERWAASPAPGAPAPMTSIDTPFPIAFTARGATPLFADESGIDDPRVLYKSPFVYTTGVIPPIVDTETGIAFGGDSVTRDMRTAALIDPRVQVMVDLGKGLVPASSIVPLGVEPPLRNASLPPTDPDRKYPKGSLSAFRVRVTLPGSIARVLANEKLQFAIESERVPGATTEQTPVSMPRAHLRMNDRAGTKDKRFTEFVLQRELAIDPALTADEIDKLYRHQSGYNKLISPWVIAIADPRASEKVTGTPTEKEEGGCVSCARPDALHLQDEPNDKVYELFTLGRHILIRPDSNEPDQPMTEALKGVYKYLGKNERLELRVPTTMADTVRGKPLTVAAQNPPVAAGALSETTYVHSGEVEVNAVDLVAQGRAGHDTVVARTHRSRTIGTTPLGLNWEAAFLRRLRQLPNGNVEYRDGEGEVWTFEPNTTPPPPPPPPPPGTSPSTVASINESFGTKIVYKSPKGLFLRLARNEHGWMMYDQQWRIARFDNYGRLTSESDEFYKKVDSTSTPSTTTGGSTTPDKGNTTFYIYDGKGRLVQILDPVGRKTDFEYYETSDPNNATCDAPFADRETKCAYTGLLKHIVEDTRDRKVLFEYDKHARLISVQRPIYKAPTDAPANADASADAKRPRVVYSYVTPTVPPEDAPLQSPVYTEFMEYSGNIAKIVDAAENAPGASGRARVRFEYYPVSDTANRDRVHFQYWPCGNWNGSACTETDAKFDYSSGGAEVTDMLGQKRTYVVEDFPHFKHIKKETVSGAPVIANDPLPATVAADAAPTGQDLVTDYQDFDPEGLTKIVVLPNGTKVVYEITDATNGAPGRKIDKITETRGSDTRETKYNYDTTNPNASATVVSIERKIATAGYSGGFTKRDQQSPSRDRKTVQRRDESPEVSTKMEMTFDDYGRPEKTEQREDAETAGSGALVEQHDIDYKDGTSYDEIERGRIDRITSSTNLETTYAYAAGPVGGESITMVDTKRNITTVVDHDANDREIHRKVTDSTGILSETWAAYDASGRVIYNARRQDPYDRVETFFTLDPLGRVVETRTTQNRVDDADNVTLSQKKEYAVDDLKVTSYDPAAPTGGAGAKLVTTLDTLGRTQRTERIAVAPTAPPGIDPTTVAQEFAYDKTGQLAYSTDTERVATLSAHDAFGRPVETLGTDKLRVKTVYDEWDQVIDAQAVGTDNSTVVSHAKSKYSKNGELLSLNEKITGSSARQTRSTWADGGKKTGERIGAASLTGDITGAARATERKYDGSGRLDEEIYGSATGTTGAITPIQRRKFEEYAGDVAQKITAFELLRGGAYSETTQSVDGLDRIRKVAVAGMYETVSDYDQAGNLTKVTPPAGKGTVVHRFDGRGLAYEDERIGAGTVRRRFDARGTLRVYGDESIPAHQTIYDVDELGRVIKITYPDFPSTTEEFRYEDKTGALLAHKDRKDVWLLYAYDDGGRITEIRTAASPSGVSTLVTTFEYDPVSKRLIRTANKDSAIEYAEHDSLGRAGLTRMYRYSGGTGLEANVAFRVVLDVHSQRHVWSVFDGERSSWRMPVTGDSASGSNGSPWRTTITEDRDASTNLVEQKAGTTTITKSAPGGIGRLLTRKRPIGTKELESTYGYADDPISAFLPQARTGALRRLETKFDEKVIAGSEIFHDSSFRIGVSDDLAFTSRQSRWTYDDRGRLDTSKLMVNAALMPVTPPIDDQLLAADFREKRHTTTVLGPSEHGQLGPDRSLTVEPPEWHVNEKPAHQLGERKMFVDGALTLTLPYEFDGGRRKSDSKWTSSYDEFGHMTSIESSDRRITYTYDPRGRIVGRKAEMKSGTTVIPLNDDLLPSETTWVWDPFVDRLIAIYETGKSTTPPGSTTPPPADAGLLRQYLHGDRAYDDPVEVLIRGAAGLPVQRYYPIADEAGTGSLQAVAGADGSLVERVIYGDSYGDAPRYLTGPVVDRVTYESGGSGVHVRVHVSDEVVLTSIPDGARLVATKADGTTITAAAPSLDVDKRTIHWNLTAAEWTALTAPGVTKVEIAITEDLRAEGWGTTPVMAPPSWAQTVYGLTPTASTPLSLVNSPSFFSSLPGGGENMLYELKALYLAGSETSKTKLHMGFHMLPFVEPVDGLIYARARWYDPATGVFLSPDPSGYADSSNLYAFAAGDPINGHDPTGEICERREGESLSDWGKRCKEDLKWVWDDFGGKTGHEIWNVFSLGTLDRVEKQKNLGTWKGVLESTFQGGRSITNSLSLGLQEEIYEAQMQNGPGLDSISQGIQNWAYNTLPMEEARALIQEWDMLPAEEKARLISLAVAKTAGLLAFSKGVAERGSLKIRQLEKGNKLKVGPYAEESFPARGATRRWRKAERDQLQEWGDEGVCHSCGTDDFGVPSGRAIGDHQPPSRLAEPKRIYPHCSPCSSEQGYQVARELELRAGDPARGTSAVVVGTTNDTQNKKKNEKKTKN